MVEIRRLTAAEGRQYMGALAEVLVDCVEGGASVSFMASLSKADAESFFEKVVEGVQRGDRILLAAFIDFKLVGTVQILTALRRRRTNRIELTSLNYWSYDRPAGKALPHGSWNMRKRPAGK